MQVLKAQPTLRFYSIFLVTNNNLSSLEYLNSVWAMILHKGHGKDWESNRSYRTISTCPLLSKALDKHVGHAGTHDKWQVKDLLAAKTPGRGGDWNVLSTRLHWRCAWNAAAPGYRTTPWSGRRHCCCSSTLVFLPASASPPPPFYSGDHE